MGIRVLIVASVASSRLLVSSASPTDASPKRQLVVVAGKEFPAQQLSREEIRNIYLGKKRFINGVRIRPLDYKRNEVRDRFLRSVVGMTSQEFKFHWLAKLFQDGVTPPEAVEDQHVIQRVKEGGGFLGYVWLDEAPTDPNLRLLLILNVPEGP